MLSTACASVPAVAWRAWHLGRNGSQQLCSAIAGRVTRLRRCAITSLSFRHQPTTHVRMISADLHQLCLCGV